MQNTITSIKDQIDNCNPSFKSCLYCFARSQSPINS